MSSFESTRADYLGSGFRKMLSAEECRQCRQAVEVWRSPGGKTIVLHVVHRDQFPGDDVMEPHAHRVKEAL